MENKAAGVAEVTGFECPMEIEKQYECREADD
jgi:hypothetical protein